MAGGLSTTAALVTRGSHGDIGRVMPCPPSSAGTFCALDICLSQLQDVGTLNIQQTVQRMRGQRAFSIQTPEQYYFCYSAVLEHAQRQGLLLPSHGRAAQDRSSSGR